MKQDSQARDIVSIKSLSVSANIGPDCWGRSRAQPLLLDIGIGLLKPLSLDKVGSSDDVNDTVNYGTSDIEISGNLYGVATLTLIHSRSIAGRYNAQEVRIHVEAPKAILLADGLGMSQVTRTQPHVKQLEQEVWWFVKDLTLGVIIGVNPPECLAKQRVIVNIEIVQQSVAKFGGLDWANLISDVTKALEASEYLTLEKFVMEVVRVACLSSEKVDVATARAQNTSAISFAHSPSVEITRFRKHFIAAQGNI
ncbi:hypothetical protein NEOLEDRAFT_1150499 [Neolentinus lepideus HHB14362 ss-1]|uniref:dihydroneopterin aldolase n=1 Tax=Neolentinus lepideus HHB14362 ss-1 TaxID=1314782 RepID=A0A165Q1E1_9AGAM|nr:hypothetical protein NEOLEDRAFT_1150499 [Neolentinus lepideus HHB14362 ss-1]